MSLLAVVVMIAWLVGAVTGFIPLYLYAARPGVAHAPAARVVAPRTAGRMVLMLVLHPRCACSRATLRVLERLIARTGSRVDVRALFVGSDGGDGFLRAQALAITGVTVEDDPSGTRARALGAETSGEALLYSTEGRLLFHGGLTASRGHEAPSAAGETLLALINGNTSAAPSTPVFGCNLGSAR